VHSDEAGAIERRVVFGSESGVELQYPARLVWPSPWIGHIPFAFWLVDALRPRSIVELGVHSGNSYCAFLQAVQSLALPAQCYGIDHWRGDEHSDYYGDDVYGELRSYHDPRYGTFSTLIRTTFEEALPYFSDSSIDLLHIDGFHSYEAVARDFSEWLPKMSPRGVVLFHDINVREREFGVWRFWEEIAARHQTFAFVHSHGLGLAYVGTEPPPASLRTLLALADPDSIGPIRSYFTRLGMSLVDRYSRNQAEGMADRARAGEADLDAARAEIRLRLETIDALRAEVAEAGAHAALLQHDLAATGLEVERQTARIAALEEHLSRARSQTSAAIAQRERATQLLRQQITVTASLQRELAAVRSELARQPEAGGASHPATADLAAQVTALGEALLGARSRVSEAIAEREKATGQLQQEIATTATLRRELAALQQNEVMTALTNRLAAVKHVIPGPLKRYIKNRIRGRRP
jgi:predicted  nucleic acid-binding Zn-ribbon protein